MLRFIAILVFLLFAGAAQALPGGNPSAAIFVATNGSDSNLGTLASPFLTIGKAQTVARAAIAAGKCPSVTFRAGTYPVAATLSFGASDSPASCFATWQSYPGESAILSGGTDLTASFTLCTTADAVCNAGANGVYQSGPVTLSAFRELYVNGSHRTRAKGANAPASWSITAGGYVSATDMSAWGNPTNIEIVSASGNPTAADKPGWQQTRCTVASMSGTAVTMATPCWTLFKTYSRGATWNASATPWWVENAYELLPTCGVGCWYYNRTTHMLYYHPNGGENMATIPVVVPQTVGLISGSGVSNIMFSRLTFAHSAWNPDVAGDDYIPVQNGIMCTGAILCQGDLGVGFSDYTLMGSALTFANSSHDLIFDHVLMTHNGGRALLGRVGTQNVTITASVFEDNGGGAIMWDDGANPSQANAALQTGGLIFRNNRVAGPFQYEDSGGLFILWARNNTVDHNYFTDNAWTPVTYGWPGGTFNTNNRLTNNLVENACQKFFDCAHYYNIQTSPGSHIVTGNYAHDTNANTVPKQACYYIDLGATGESVNGNVCDPTAATVNWAFVHISNSNVLTSNYTTNATVLDTGSGNTISGTKTYTSGAPSVDAAVIIANSGIQAGVTPGP